MATKPKRTYISFRNIGEAGQQSWAIDPKAWMPVHRRPGKHGLRYLSMEVRFYRELNEHGEMTLYMERKLGYACGPIPYEKLPPINLGRVEKVYAIRHYYIDDYHSKVKEYNRDGTERAILPDVRNITDKEIASYMAKTGQFLLDQSLSIFTAP